MKKLAVLLLPAILCFAFAACGGQGNEVFSGPKPGAESSSTAGEPILPAEYDTNNLYSEVIDPDAELIEYGVFYKAPLGEPVFVVNIGRTSPHFNIIGSRIYYADCGTLYSVDLQGKDMQILSLAGENDDGIEIQQVTDYDNDWLYCRATKWEMITGDPVALDGLHRVDTRVRVAHDFSKWEPLESEE